MDRNSKELNFSKTNLRIIMSQNRTLSCNMIFERPFLTNANTLRFKYNEAFYRVQRKSVLQPAI